jgi:hypothetical protein
MKSRRPVNADFRRHTSQMTHPKTFALILEEFKQRATGKIPFGPVDDLQQFYESLEIIERARFLKFLSGMAQDEFWTPFITMFDEWRNENHFE